VAVARDMKKEIRFREMRRVMGEDNIDEDFAMVDLNELRMFN